MVGVLFVFVAWFVFDRLLGVQLGPLRQFRSVALSDPAWTPHALIGGFAAALQPTILLYGFGGACSARWSACCRGSGRR